MEARTIDYLFSKVVVEVSFAERAARRNAEKKGLVVVLHSR